MEVRLLDYTRDPLMVLTAVKAKIEGKHKKVDDITETEALEDFKDSLNSGIYGVFEFIDFTFDVIGVSRSFTHQAVRTRHASYMQESLRFSAHRGKLFQYHTGPSIDSPEKKEIYDGVMKSIQESYEKLLDAGVATEDAMGVLPSDILTSIVIKIDYRNLLHMAGQRLCFQSQLEHREFMTQVKLLISTKVHPLLGEQLKPDCMKQGFCTWGSRLDRPCELQKRYPVKRIA